MGEVREPKIEWLYEGFRRALERFKAGEGRHEEPRATFIPLFETLGWAGSLVELLKKRQQGLYPRLEGIRWVRNRTLHQWADAIEAKPVFYAPRKARCGDQPQQGVQPGPFYHWFWRETHEIPNDPKYENTDGE